MPPSLVVVIIDFSSFCFGLVPNPPSYIFVPNLLLHYLRMLNPSTLKAPNINMIDIVAI